MPSAGELYIIPTPIGNPDDITLRALKTLRSVDFIICEEEKQARRLLSQYDIQKPLLPLNEHNETEAANEVLGKLSSGLSAGLISDCGTPLFSDPGHYLLSLCVSASIHIIPLPGASSLMTALSAAHFSTEKFYYYGWLSPKKDIRKQQLAQLKSKKDVVVFLETPYRLGALLRDMCAAFGKDTQAFLAFDLTLPAEHLYRGALESLLFEAEKEKLKGEFVLLVDLRKK